MSISLRYASARAGEALQKKGSIILAEHSSSAVLPHCSPGALLLLGSSHPGLHPHPGHGHLHLREWVTEYSRPSHLFYLTDLDAFLTKALTKLARDWLLIPILHYNSRGNPSLSSPGQHPSHLPKTQAWFLMKTIKIQFLNRKLYM